MADLRHKWVGVEIEEPRNWDQLEISHDFLGRQEEASVNLTTLEFAGDTAIEMIQRVKNGLSGGVGIFEGDKYEVEVGEAGNPAFVFEGFLDYADGVEIKGCDEISVPIKKENGVDWLEGVADGFSFRYLHDEGVITSSDFVKVPYVINYVPDNMQLVVLGMSLFMMTKELIQLIQDIADAISETINAATPNVGLGVTWDVGDVIWVVLKTLARIAYAVAIVIGIKNLIEEIIEQLIPKKRYHLGMRLYTLFERACDHLGLGFSSQLLTERYDWVLIPPKGHKGGEAPEGFTGNFVERGVPGADEPYDTFKDLIIKWSEYLYADFKIINNVFHFERADNWDSQGNFVIPDFFTDQKALKDVFKPNTSEMISNYNIYWAYDTQDQNTLDRQDGRVFQAITEPNIETNRKYRNIKGLESVGIQASLGLRKDELTKVEEVVKDLAGFVDTLTGLFGSGTNYAQQIEERKGSLLLSSHFLTVPKMVVMKGNKLASNQRDLLSAQRLWNELHYISSLAEVNGHHNQWLRYEKVKVPFCIEDFVSLMDNNYCQDSEGKSAMVERLKWRSWENWAEIDYRIKEKYTDNLKLKYVT
jgi:hypothetical protein